MSGGMIAWLEDSLIEDGYITADQWDDFQNTMCESAQAWFEDNKPEPVMPRWNPEGAVIEQSERRWSPEPGLT